MFKQFRDRVALSGISVLLIGVALLVFTFISAYEFLTQNLSIIASEDLVGTFDEALAPLIATCIRIMYLGIMGWIGSLLTIRGIAIIAHLPEASAVIAQKTAALEQTQQPQKAETESPHLKEPKAKQSEPELIVMPQEEVLQTASQPSQKEKSESQPAS